MIIIIRIKQNIKKKKVSNQETRFFNSSLNSWFPKVQNTCHLPPPIIPASMIYYDFIKRKRF